MRIWTGYGCPNAVNKAQVGAPQVMRCDHRLSFVTELDELHCVSCGWRSTLDAVLHGGPALGVVGGLVTLTEIERMVATVVSETGAGSDAELHATAALQAEPEMRIARSFGDVITADLRDAILILGGAEIDVERVMPPSVFWERLQDALAGLLERVGGVRHLDDDWGDPEEVTHGAERVATVAGVLAWVIAKRWIARENGRTP